MLQCIHRTYSDKVTAFRYSMKILKSMLTQVVDYVNCEMTKRMFSLKITEKVERESSQKLCKVKQDIPLISG